MDSLIVGNTIRILRKRKGMTQAMLADKIGVGAKAVSKWENAKGLPDIALLAPLAEALGISVAELISGEPIRNRNISSNLLRAKFYICPICGNVLFCMGEASISCCGIMLAPLPAKEADEAHMLSLEAVEDEHFIRIEHEMKKDHFISFVAFVSADGLQLKKLYPEGNAETRLRLRGHGLLYWYCSRDGLFKMKR
ncbi:MAG: helix-turn-helix domain-containing protein [Christensenellaceae bacterium]|nr:helix-turn-helix domain-containing protein [Christensenellaceae bacterium]